MDIAKRTPGKDSVEIADDYAVIMSELNRHRGRGRAEVIPVDYDERIDTVAGIDKEAVLRDSLNSYDLAKVGATTGGVLLRIDYQVYYRGEYLGLSDINALGGYELGDRLIHVKAQEERGTLRLLEEDLEREGVPHGGFSHIIANRGRLRVPGTTFVYFMANLEEGQIRFFLESAAQMINRQIGRNLSLR